jgi:hypothetical protein
VHRCATCSALLNPGDEARHVHCAAPGCAAPAFGSEAEAARHAEVHHGAFACDECGAVGMTHGAVFEGHLAAACPRRVVACDFCGEQRFRAEKLEEHKRECGARTDTCAKCKRFVRRIDKALHKATNCAEPRSTSPARLHLPFLGGGAPGGGAAAAPAAAPAVDGLSAGEVDRVLAAGARMGFQGWTLEGARQALLYNLRRGVGSAGEREKRAVEWLLDHPA